MAQRTSSARLEEWARLLGASVPDRAVDDDRTERARSDGIARNGSYPHDQD